MVFMQVPWYASPTSVDTGSPISPWTEWAGIGIGGLVAEDEQAELDRARAEVTPRRLEEDLVAAASPARPLSVTMLMEGKAEDTPMTAKLRQLCRSVKGYQAEDVVVAKGLGKHRVAAENGSHKYKQAEKGEDKGKAAKKGSDKYRCKLAKEGEDKCKAAAMGMAEFSGKGRGVATLGKCKYKDKDKHSGQNAGKGKGGGFRSNAGKGKGLHSEGKGKGKALRKGKSGVVKAATLGSRTGQQWSTRSVKFPQQPQVEKPRPSMAPYLRVQLLQQQKRQQRQQQQLQQQQQQQQQQQPTRRQQMKAWRLSWGMRA